MKLGACRLKRFSLYGKEVESAYCVSARVNESTGHDLDEDDSKGKDIGGEVEMLSIDDLGTHVSLPFYQPEYPVDVLKPYTRQSGIVKAYVGPTECHPPHFIRIPRSDPRKTEIRNLDSLV